MGQVPRGVDIFNLESFLTNEEIAVRDSVRTFVNEEFTPTISENWRLGKFPKELSKRMGSLGLLGPHLAVPGREPMSRLASGVIFRELERGDASIRSFASVQGCLVMEAISRYGTEQQKEKWLPKLASGVAIGAFAIAEPDHGSDPNQMSTTAVLSNDNYIISGKKTWTTNGSIADIIIVWARTDTTIQGFIVEPSVRGFSSNDIRGKHGMRISVQSELTFDDCTIPKRDALPGAVGLKTCLVLLNIARYAIAWGAVGAAEACFEEAFSHVKKRTSLESPLDRSNLFRKNLLIWQPIFQVARCLPTTLPDLLILKR